MRSCLVVLFFCLLLGALAHSEPLELNVRSYPPGALLKDQFGNELGRSNEAFTIDWDRSKGSLHLTLSKDGHKSVHRTLSFIEIREGVYPKDDEIRLPANSLAVRLGDVWKYQKPGLFLSLLALGLLGLGGRQIWTSSRQNPSVEEDEHIGPYQVHRKLGMGASATVLEVTKTNDSSAIKMALKLMREVQTPQDKERFKREIKTSLGLKHSNLVEVYDWGELSDGRLYMVTEFLKGQTLREYLEKESRPGPMKIQEVLEGLSEALEYIHGQNVVHRDVKPDNIFLPESGGVKLVDLGIAQGGELSPLTQLGTAVGTPHYMAPEQAKGAATPLSDQYALGVVAFEMLAGRRPFGGSQGVEILQKHLQEPVPALSQFRRESNANLESALEKCLAKRPESRFASPKLAASAIILALTEGDSYGQDTEESAIL